MALFRKLALSFRRGPLCPARLKVFARFGLLGIAAIIALPPPAASTCTCSRARIRCPAATSIADQRSARPPGRRHGRPRPVARRRLFLYRQDRQQSRRRHAFPRDQRSAGARPRALQHLSARPATRASGDGNGFVPSRGFSAQAAVVPHRAAAESARRIFLRRDHRRLRHHARLRLADSAAGSLEHRGLHPCLAVEPERDHGRRPAGTENSLRAAEVPRARIGRDLARARAGNQFEIRGEESK